MDLGSRKYKETNRIAKITCDILCPKEETLVLTITLIRNCKFQINICLINNVSAETLTTRRNRISGLMINMLASSAVDRGFEL